MLLHNIAIIDLNNPFTRQNALLERVDLGTPLVIKSLSSELGISPDTVRRDLIALEQKGLVRRVRGGAVPITVPTPSYLARISEPGPAIEPLAERAARLIPDKATVFLDAGVTMNAVAMRLSDSFSGLIVTPAPSVALSALSRRAQIHLIGGVLCPEGTMSTGGETENSVRDYAADLCFLGACGLRPEFGLSAEDKGEAAVKRAMALSSSKTIVVTSAEYTSTAKVPYQAAGTDPA